MPVLVVGAETAAGRAAVRRLLRCGGEVRAYADAERAGEQAAVALRTLGAKVAVGDLDDEGHLEAALQRVHTVVHLAGNPFEPQAALDALATTLSAALGAGCRRIVWVSELAAASPAGNSYLQALAEAEELLAAAPLESVILRCGLRYGRDDSFARRLAVADLSNTDQQVQHAPLHIGDLAQAVTAADRQRDARSDLHLAVELVGPDRVSLASLSAALRRAWRLERGSERLPADVADWLSRPAVGGAQALGRDGTPLEQALDGE